MVIVNPPRGNVFHIHYIEEILQNKMLKISQRKKLKILRSVQLLFYGVEEKWLEVKHF